ncbi:phytanoyl-CoA dioxygenase family protein [Pseudonocardia sp. CA-107938]|uniref:phytanoyl-CoA dioxygenase family protein n=1 Tax=Pseudonocardia sp. CA-107938 TaxID=3240021 RepID=UPI003D94084B
MSTVAPPKADLDFFDRNGYLVVNDVFDQETEIKPLVAEYMELIDRLVAGWVADGTLSSDYADLAFPERLARVLSETGAKGYMPLDISLPSKSVDPSITMHYGPALFNLLNSPRLLDVVEQFIGPEIQSNPIQRTRIKPPERLLSDTFDHTNVKRSAWHQDQGVAMPVVDESNMLTVWVAVTDATVENGCLCVIPGSHKGGMVKHCIGDHGGTHIPPSARNYDDGLPLPVRSGGIVLFHRRTIHGSLANVSDGIRWSFDLRFQPIGEPTGRDWCPVYNARSKAHPESVVTDWREVATMWKETRERLIAEQVVHESNRWGGVSCA